MKFTDLSMGKAKLNLAIAGLGRGFMLTLPALRAHPQVRLAGAFDLREDAVGHFAEEFDAKGFSTFDGILSDREIDAVYIATPHELHAEFAVAALAAGKHVLVEKPMATSISDGKRMATAATEAGKVLLVGPSHGFDQPVIQAVEILKTGRYGQVRMVTALNFTDFMYRPRRPEELDEARGGGVVYSQATHQIDVVRKLVGQRVESIRAATGNWDDSRLSNGAYTALMTFAGGAVASLPYSGYAHYDSDELVGWISELGHVKDPGQYGQTRRKLAELADQDEMTAKLARTYGAANSSTDIAAPHHEHFGFVLVSCERADIKVLPTCIEIYGDEAVEVLEVPPPEIPRATVIEEFAAAIEGTNPPTHDGQWGLETMACCTALIRSSEAKADVRPDAIIEDSTETI